MPIEVSCFTCGKVVAKRPRDVKERNYCSRECHYRSGVQRPNRRLGTTKQCEVCASDFYAPRNRPEARFCSRRCKGVASRAAFACEVCGTEAYGFNNLNKRWCSQKCALEARRTGQHKVCQQCGSTFYVTKSRVDKGQGQFCSITCHNLNQGRNKTVHTCVTCGEDFRWSPSRSAGGQHNIKYCSIACRDQDPEYRASVIASHTRLLRGRVTRAEAAGYALLDSLGVQHERQAVFNSKFTPDALVSEAMLVIQFDGDYWHDRKGTSTEARIRRRVALDRSQDAYIRTCGWRVLRLWESDLLSDPEGCAEKIRQHLCPPS